MEIRNKQRVAVEIASPTHELWVDVPAGGVVEVPYAVALSLCKQEDNWERAEQAKPKPRKTAAAKRSKSEAAAEIDEAIEPSDSDDVTDVVDPDTADAEGDDN